MLAGVAGYFTVGKTSPESPHATPAFNQELQAPREKPLVLYYAFPAGEAIINEYGEVTLEIARDDYQCTVIDPQPAANEGRPPAPTLLETLFGIASSPQFLSAEQEYLPPKGSFADQGHASRTTITLKDGAGNTMQSVVYSDQPERTPPPAVTDLGTAIYQYVWGYNRERLEKACGSVPETRQELD